VQAGGSGCVSITGVSGNGSSGSAYGILASGSTVTSSSGSITFIGTSRGTGAAQAAVYLLSSSNISATDTGNVIITGTVANGAGNSRSIIISGSTVTTNTGTLTVNGTSCATGSDCFGVYLKNSSNISATGAGNVTITGTSAYGAYAYGIYAKQSIVTTRSGSLTVNGTSFSTAIGSRGVGIGSSTFSSSGGGNVTITGWTENQSGIGIYSFVTNDLIASSGGLISLTANSLILTGTVNATQSGNVSIQTFGAGVDLGNGTDTVSNMGLSQTELNQITASTLTIGSSTAGNITVSAPISWPTNLTLITGGKYFGLTANLTVSGTLLTPSVAPILVTNANNSGSGSLRDAIAIASTNVGDDQISFDSNLTGSTISLLTPLTINDLSGYLSLTGPGASNLSISGGGSTGIFSVYSPASFSGLTLTNGTGANGTSPNLQGGAIYTNSTLILTNVTINNSTANFGSAIYQTGGSLTLTASHIVNSVYFTGNGNLTVSSGSLGSNVTVASGNTVSIINYTSTSDLFSFGSNSIILSNITASGNLTVSGNTSTSCISVTGSLSATGANSISLTGRNIVVAGSITAQAGDITLYGNGGEGISKLEGTSVVLKRKILKLINRYKQPIVMQKYLSEIKEGDRRIILIDGEYAGSVARIPKKGSVTANFHTGGTAKKVGLVRRDKKICNILKPFLKKNKLFFTGIDVIGNYLTEINVTSPTGIQEINRLNGARLEKFFWDRVEKKLR